MAREKTEQIDTATCLSRHSSITLPCAKAADHNIAISVGTATNNHQHDIENAFELILDPNSVLLSRCAQLHDDALVLVV